VTRGWTSRKHEEYQQSIHGQRQATGFLKRTSAKKKSWGITQFEQKPAKNNDATANRALSFKGHLLQPLTQPHIFFVTVRHWKY
jgi:hypothetical protein